MSLLAWLGAAFTVAGLGLCVAFFAWACYECTGLHRVVEWLRGRKG